MQPSPLTIVFQETLAGGATETLWADMFQAISAEQRRAHRQGKTLAVSGIRFSADNACNIEIFALPTTWVFAEAWSLAYRSWQKLNRMALADTDGSMRAPYKDFKVYASWAHAQAVQGATATNYAIFPIGFTAAVGAPETTYDWDYALLRFPEDVAETDTKMCMLGPDTASGHHTLGIIHNYALSRARPPAPDHNVPGDDTTLQHGRSVFNVMFDTGDNYDEVITDLVEHGNSPPYPLGLQVTPAGTLSEEYYPGGSNYKPQMTHYPITKLACGTASISSTNRKTAFCPGFLAPLGIIAFELTSLSGVGSNVDIYVDLVPGDDKGILTQRLQEMN